MTVARRFAVVAALVVATTAAVALPSGGSPAEAAAPCAGVLVVIDPGALGGGTEQDCVAVHAYAADDVTAAGHALTGTQQFPKLVCRVDGEPADQPCVGAPPADAYWGLYWTNGRTGRWSYASLGAYSLSVPKGGGVAFAWQDGTTSTPPDVAAPKAPVAAHGPGVSPRPSSHPRPSVTPKPAASPSPKHATSPSPKPTPSPSVRPRRPGRHHSAAYPKPVHQTVSTTPWSNGSAYSSKLTITPESTPGSSGGGLPGWVAPAIVIVLAGGSGYAVRHRRRR